MSANCPTCKSSLNCGCQLRTASNGVRVCTLCVGKYEAALTVQKAAAGNPSTAPTNLQATNPPRT
jgi:hypothetical protein